MFQDDVSKTHGLSYLLREVHILNILMWFLLRMPSKTFHSIIFIKDPKMKHLLYALCFPHHTAKVELLRSRKKHVYKVIVWNKHSGRDRSHVVTLIQRDSLNELRQKPNRLHLSFIHRLVPNFLYILPNLTSVYGPFLSPKPLITSASAVLGVQPVLMSFAYFLRQFLYRDCSRPRT